MTVIDRADLSSARARAGRIRQGIHDYLGTLAEIAKAYQERDWTTLGYADWASYVDEEFGADRLKLPAAHRQKAVEELRLAGMSTRAIGAAVGASKDTVLRDLSGPGVSSDTPDAVLGADGKTYAATNPPVAEPDPAPLVAAVTAAIEGTVERQREQPEWSEQELELRQIVEAGGTVVATMRGPHRNLLVWAEQANRYTRIDRRSEWGNPFEIPGDGDRAAVINSYAVHYLPHKPSLLAKLEDLRGSVLACWCWPEACHGDILVDLLESP